MHNPSGYVFLTDKEYINNLISVFSHRENFNKQKLQEYFGNQITKGEGNTFRVTGLPKYFTTDEFILPKGSLPNVFSDTETSVGLFLFNSVCIADIFGDRVPYYNPETGMNPDAVGGLIKQIVSLLSMDKVTGEEFGMFQNRFNWLGYNGTLWSPGQSFDFAKVNPEVAKNKPILLKKWRDAVDAGAEPVSSYVLMVEKPLLAIAKNSLKTSESWPLYARGGKPKFSNVYKNCTVSMGPVFDPISGKYTIATNSFMDGIENDMIPTFANIQVDAAYNRAVATQDGGAKTKQIFAALQSVRLDPKRGSDCGSKMYIKKKLTKKNYDKNAFRFIYDPEKKAHVRLTPENCKEYFDKEVLMRTPTFCKNPEYCNVCAGDYFYILGLVNVGNATTRLSSTLMNKALKAMHDVSVDADFIDPFQYMEIIK